MINHGIVRSTVMPEAKIVDEESVWVSSHVVPVQEGEGDNAFTGYKYNLARYSKDEYIDYLDKKNTSLEMQVTDIQLALCDVYEATGG